MKRNYGDKMKVETNHVGNKVLLKQKEKKKNLSTIYAKIKYTVKDRFSD